MARPVVSRHALVLLGEKLKICLRNHNAITKVIKRKQCDWVVSNLLSAFTPKQLTPTIRTLIAKHCGSAAAQCGKALPFRLPLVVLRLRLNRRRSLPRFLSGNGKAEPYRTVRRHSHRRRSGASIKIRPVTKIDLDHVLHAHQVQS